MQRKTQRASYFASRGLLSRLLPVPLTAPEYTLSAQSMQDVELAVLARLDYEACIIYGFFRS
jgi:hypothetical protein